MFGKGGSGFLTNHSVCGTGATVSFSAGSVCLSLSAEACAILQALCWSRQHQQVYHFSSRLLRLSLCPLLRLSFYLSTLWQIWQEPSSLSSFAIRLQWVPRHSLHAGNDATDKLERRGLLLAASAILCSLSPLTFRIHFNFLSDWRRSVSSKFFDTQIFSVSTEVLVLPHHARFVLSRFRFNTPSLSLNSSL